MNETGQQRDRVLVHQNKLANIQCEEQDRAGGMQARTMSVFSTHRSQLTNTDN